MAKIAQTQGFTKAIIYRDGGRWLLEEIGKDSNETFDFERDILQKWENVENISISIKCEGEYAPAVKDDMDV